MPSCDLGIKKSHLLINLPILQHHLERRPQRLHHKLDHQLIKSGPRLEGVMGAPDYAPDYDSEDYDEADYARERHNSIEF